MVDVKVVLEDESPAFLLPPGRDDELGGDSLQVADHKLVLAKHIEDIRLVGINGARFPPLALRVLGHPFLQFLHGTGRFRALDPLRPLVRVPTLVAGLPS